MNQYFQNINQNNNQMKNYYYIPDNEVNSLVSKDNSRNNEPQDNIKKSKRRRQLELEKQLKLKADKDKDHVNSFHNANEEWKEKSEKEKFENILINNTENKSLTEFKAIRTNKIFKNESIQNTNNMNNEQNLNENINITKSDIIYNNKEKIYKINSQNNFNIHSLNNSSNNNYHSNLSSSPKIVRKPNLSVLNNIDVYNMTSRNYRINNKYDNYFYKFKDKDKDDNTFQCEKISQYNNTNNLDNTNNYKRIKSLNHYSQNINYNYKRVNSSKFNYQNTSTHSSSSDNNNNEIKFYYNKDIEELNCNEKVPMDNIKKMKMGKKK